jgi:hypothetical protein
MVRTAWLQMIALRYTKSVLELITIRPFFGRSGLNAWTATAWVPMIAHRYTKSDLERSKARETTTRTGVIWQVTVEHLVELVDRLVSAINSIHEVIES